MRSVSTYLKYNNQCRTINDLAAFEHQCSRQQLLIKHSQFS